MDKTLFSAGHGEEGLARLRAEIQFLRSQLEESQDTLRAIRAGEVDALVVSTPEGERIFTLQGGEHPYRALIEQMREGAATLTPEGIVHYCNGRFAEMLKVPLEAVMGGRMEEFVAPADRATFSGILGAGEGLAELTLMAASGTEVSVLMSAVSLRAEGPAAVCLVISDLTERKRHEAEIGQLNRELEERVVQRTAQLAAANRELNAIIAERMQAQISIGRLAAIVDSSDDAILSKDLDGIIRTWNSGAERLLGYRAEEVVGRPIMLLVPAERYEEEEQVLSKIRNGQRVEHLDTLRLAKDGRSIEVSVTLSPVKDQDGKIIGASTVARDITDRKRAERELKATKNLAEQAKAAAEQANRAKDQFLAVLSHEMRTPLTPVVMGLSMLQDRPDLDPSTREILEMVRRNVEMETRLIDDLLDVSRIARGKINLSRSVVELRTVIERAVEVCKPDIQERGLRFDVEMGPARQYWVDADISRLQQVFWNLLKNAVKFTPRGGCISLRCQPSEKHVEVEVNDSGLGIESDALLRIFNAFEQADDSITQQFGGLGLGLAISKVLVEMHGGQIEAYSEGHGKGATFRVRLPLTAAPGQPEMRAPAATRQSVVRPLNILLVEDHEVTAKLMRMVLTKDSHTVETVGSIAAAVELAGQHAFDLLVSDLGLPDGSGYDLIRQLRQAGHTFPALALSGYGREENRQRSQEAGFAAHLTKPASRKALEETILSITTTEYKRT
jgi:two-component system CheB/CheR fusion protein